MWIKLLSDYAGHKAGERIDEEEAIARAYVAAGKAEAAPETVQSLIDTATAELRRSQEEMMTSFTSGIKVMADELKNAGAQFRSATSGSKRPNPQAPSDDFQIEATASEDEKFIAHRGGFRTMGHFAFDTYRAFAPQSSFRDSQERIAKWNDTLSRVSAVKRAAGSPDGMYENSDPDGGVLVPPDFSSEIWERVYIQENLLTRTDSYNVTGNTLVLPANTETSRVDGSRWGGTLGYWEGEAQQFTGSRPKFRDLQLRLKKLTILTYVTNELLSDAGIALDQYLQRNASNEIVFKIVDALINGTGAGIPLGIANDPALIAVAKETNQAAKTVLYENILKLYNRMWAPCRKNAIWLINQEIEPQLDLMALPVGTGGVPVYTGAGSGLYGGAEAPRLAMLKGRPVLPIEQCQALGTQGDIFFVDFSQYVTIVKGAIQSSMSIHLKFDYDETVFKWLFRMDGQGAWSKALTPKNGTNTYSFVTTLAAR